MSKPFVAYYSSRSYWHRLKSFLPSTVTLFNSLPSSAVSCSSKSSFAHAIDIHNVEDKFSSDFCDCILFLFCSIYRASSFSTSRSAKKRPTGLRLEAIARPWYFVFQTCCAPFVENARSLSAGRKGRAMTCASKSIGKESGSPQVKSMSNALGKTGSCLVGVV